jgi:hypothetical protein
VGVGLALLTFCYGAFSYTIASVSKDDFSDFDSDGIKKTKFEEQRGARD